MKKLKKILLEGIRNSFTLIELIVVIVILGILAAIVVPNISSLKEDAIPVAVSNNERSLQTAIDMYGLDHNGKLPTVLNPTIENPQPPDYSALYPDYIRSKPEVGHYLIDVFGKVWGSTSIAPNQINYASGEFSFKAVETATEYELLEYGQTETINGSAGNAVGKYKVQKFADLPLEGKQAKDIYRVANPDNKSLLVSAIDKYGLKAAPVGEDHLGVQEGLPIAGTETFYLTTDAKGKAVWEGLQTHEILPDGTSIDYSFATSDNGKTFGTDFVTDISTLENSRYLKVKVEMKTTNNNKPTLTYLKVIYHLLDQAEDVAVHVPVTPIVLGASEEDKTFVEIIDFGTTKPIGSVEYAGREKIKIVYESSVDGVTYSPATPYPNELPEGRYVKVISTPERDGLTVHSPEIKKIVVHNSVVEPVESGTVVVPEEETGNETTPPPVVTDPSPIEETPPVLKVNHFVVGDYVDYGKHYDGTDITWQVAQIKDGLAMLTMHEPLRQADGTLLVKPFDLSPNVGENTDALRTSNGSNNWANSDIRKWLNEDFYNEAFTYQDRVIQPVTHDYILSTMDVDQATKGAALHEYDLYNGLQNYNYAYRGTTTDHIYYLSIKEYYEILGPIRSGNGIYDMTAYNSSVSTLKDYHHQPAWKFNFTLRDSYPQNGHQVRIVDSPNVMPVNSAKYINPSGNTTDATAILPAMTIATDLFQYGEGLYENPHRIEKYKKDAYIEYGMFNGKPLLWEVIKEENGEYMLFLTDSLQNSDGTTYMRMFDEGVAGGTARETYGSNDWELSDIRQWLNGEFLSNLPNGSSRLSNKNNNYILNSLDSTKATSGSEPYAHTLSEPNKFNNYATAYQNVTTDKVALPNLDEIYHTIAPKIGSRYIKIEGVIKPIWTRDAAEANGSKVLYLRVGQYGRTSDEEYRNANFAGGVRPIIYLDKTLLHHGDGTLGTEVKPYTVR